MDVTKDRANEFIELVSQEGQTWENAVDKFNELYGQAEPNDINDANLPEREQVKDVNEIPFELQNLTSLRRLLMGTKMAPDRVQAK